MILKRSTTLERSVKIFYWYSSAPTSPLVLTAEGASRQKSKWRKCTNHMRIMYLHTMKTAHVRFQTDVYLTVGGVAHTNHQLCIWILNVDAWNKVRKLKKWQTNDAAIMTKLHAHPQTHFKMIGTKLLGELSSQSTHSLRLEADGPWGEVSNGLDPDQDWRSVGPDLVPNHSLHRISADDKSRRQLENS